MKSIVKFVIFITILLSSNIVFSQLKVSSSGNSNQADPSSVLELESTDKGLLLPRISDLNLIQNPAPGLIVFLTADSKLYNYTASGWEALTLIDTTSLSNRINSKLDTLNGIARNLTIRNNLTIEDLVFKNIPYSGYSNIAIGKENLINDPANFRGNNNIALGDSALRITNGNDLGNLGIGLNAMPNNSTGNSNIAIGPNSLKNLPSGDDNIAIGPNTGISIRNDASRNILIGNGADVDPNDNLSYDQFSLANSFVGKNINGGTARYGINTRNPSATFDINGNIRIRGGNPGRNRVLTSDIDGNARWANLNLFGVGGQEDPNDPPLLDLRPYITEDEYSLLINQDTASLSARINAKLNSQNGTASNLTVSDSLRVNGIYLGRGNGNNQTNTIFGKDANSAYAQNTSYNTIFGYGSFQSNTTGSYNTGIGAEVGGSNTTGNGNVAIGYQNLVLNRTGSGNISVGTSSLRNNTIGNKNTAVGDSALLRLGFGNNINFPNNTNVDYNSALGYYGLGSLRRGRNNIGIGNNSFYVLLAGNGNIALGDSAGKNLSSGNYNIAIGVNNNFRSSSESNQLVIANSIFGSNIYDINTANIGIRTNDPTAALDINGTLRIRGGNPGAGKVLISDASGHATWGLSGLTFDTTYMSNRIDSKLGKINDTVQNINNTGVIKLIRIGDDVDRTDRSIYIGNGGNLDNVVIGSKALLNPPVDPIPTFNTIVGNLTASGLISGYSNTLMGFNIASSMTRAGYNTAMGESSLVNIRSGDYNTVLGHRALENLETGYNNIAIGSKSGGSDFITGNNNISIGSQLDYVIENPPNFTFYSLQNPLLNGGNNQFVLANSLFGLEIYDRANAKYGIGTNAPTATLDIAGGLKIRDTLNVNGMHVGKGKGNISSNLAIGIEVLYSNTTGSFNYANGYRALYSNTTGSANNANGYQALYQNTTGSRNIANGFQALGTNTTGNSNTGVGYQALFNNSTGNYNTAYGNQALRNIATGNNNNNTALGDSAGINLRSGSKNIAIGAKTNFPSTTGSYQMNIGNEIYGLNVDDPSTNVLIGIGKSNPTATLDIAGNLNVSTTVNGMNFGRGAGGLESNTVVGNLAFFSNQFGTNNTAIGNRALYFNGASGNTANGHYALYNNTLGANNSAFGSFALQSNTTGNYNTAFGFQALNSNVAGDYNSAYGNRAIFTNTGGLYNTAIGYEALFSNNTNDNTAIGYRAIANSTGTRNIGLGVSSGQNISTGTNNIAIGNFTNLPSETGNYQLNIGNEIYGLNVDDPSTNVLIGIGKSNPTATLDIAGGLNVSDTLRARRLNVSETVNGIHLGRGNRGISTNTAVGFEALFGNFSGALNGGGNTANGYQALRNNYTGTNNTANGYQALSSNDGGEHNTANGYQALYSNNSGQYNTAVGYKALLYSRQNNNTALGREAGQNLTTGSNNIAIGSGTNLLSATGNYQLNIGNEIYGRYVDDPTNGNTVQIAIGTTTFNGTNMLTVSGTVAANGTVLSSDRRFKKDIQGINLGLKEVLQLKPSSYHWDTTNERMKSANPTKLQYGFIAQELETIIPDVVSDDGSEKEYKSVNYEALIPVLTKAIQEQQEMINAMKKEIEILKRGKSGSRAGNSE